MGCDDADRGVHVLDHAMTERVAGVRTRGKLLFWVRLTTPRSSRQDDPAAIDDLYPGSRARRSPQRAIAQRFSASARLTRWRSSRRRSLVPTDSGRLALDAGTRLRAPKPTFARTRGSMGGAG